MSILIISSISINIGTKILNPVSHSTYLFDELTESPFTASSALVTKSSTDVGSETSITLLLYICIVNY